MRAELAVGFQLFTERYTSQVHMVPGVLVEVCESGMSGPVLTALSQAALRFTSPHIHTPLATSGHTGYG